MKENGRFSNLPWLVPLLMVPGLVLAELLIQLQDGETIRIPVDSNDIQSIQFLPDANETVTPAIEFGETAWVAGGRLLQAGFLCP